MSVWQIALTFGGTFGFLCGCALVVEAVFFVLDRAGEKLATLTLIAIVAAIVTATAVAFDVAAGLPA